ncbi:UDP-N-acetylmuramate dehydrogenase [Mycobacterium sp. MBM]|nr:UDP-N-acetylmuramate dehydrogenase [Mycobacterium sp. MBM]
MVTRSADLVAAVTAADRAGQPVLVMGGGSNLVVGDQGFDGLVAHVRTNGISVQGETIHVDAGVDWDAVVEFSLEHGLGGLEPLSGVPGTVGGTPVQNVGAYGTLVSDFLDYVTAFDRDTAQVIRIPNAECGFGSHRQSIFKHSHRWVILSVTFTLACTTMSRPVKFASLADRLGVQIGACVPTSVVRETVLQMRRDRAMLLDESDHDTWSVGSFFINPVLATVPERAREAPTYPDVLGTKLPAGWLIDHAGFPPGYGKDWGRGNVRLSTRHALAVTNWGGATTLEVMRFAAHIRDGVEHAFDIRLGPECDLVNCSFDD